ncbi:MAG: DUF445 family protein [Selenomonadales bacterium]|nr:DUF445 family protein [Selenomonadales bacterium]
MTMRKTADIVLVSLAALFVLSLLLMRAVGDPVWLLAVQAMLEGALVGSIADWFAVRALFGAPLGITFHTRLVPRNRDRLIRAIADGVQNRILTRTVIRSHLAKRVLTDMLIEKAESYGIERGLMKVWDEEVKPNICGQKAADMVLEKVGEAEMPSVLSAETAHTVSEAVLTWAANKAETEDFRQTVESYLEQFVTEKTASAGMLGALFGMFAKASGTVDTHDASVKLSRAVAGYLREASADGHMTKLWLTAEVRTILARIDEKAVMVAYLDDDSVQGALRRSVTAAIDGGEGTMKALFVAEGVRLWQMLKQDDEFVTELEAKLRLMLYRFIEMRRDLIGAAISRTLSAYSEDEMRASIEEKVGDDLEWVRMNGAVLGGMLGLVLFFVLYAGGIVLG